MDWTNKKLKEQANDAVHTHFWKSSFITTMLLVFSYGTFFSVITDFIAEVPTAVRDIYNSLTSANRQINMQLIAVVITLTCGMLLLNTVVKLVINIFVKNPVDIGAALFMKKALKETTSGEVADLAYAFDHDYINIVKVMVITHIVSYLWMLLLVVPGIIKLYEYRMVPYLLSENGHMTAKEAMAISKEMMMGNKKQALIMDLSFIPWHILGFITLGILEVFYVRPLQALTNAALYETLNEQRMQSIQAE